MKSLILLTLLGAITFTGVRGQANDPRVFNLNKAHKYHKMRVTGTVLTIVGAGLFIGGLSSISKSSSTNTGGSYNGSNYNSTQSNISTEGALAYLAGVASLGAGIPLWIVGGHAEKKYLRKLEFDGYSGALDPSRSRHGVTLRYTF